MEDIFQLDFDFESPVNRLLTSLNKGDFITFFEINTPPKKNDFKTSVNFLKSMDAAVKKIRGLNTGLAVTDKIESVDSWNIADFASAGLSKSTLDRNIIYISGKKASPSEIKDTVKRCSSLGLRNIVPVTGDGYPDEIEKNSTNQHCFDSAQTLRTIKGIHESDVIYPGCVVNPFKYTSSDIFSQYFKLVKKINFGSRFIVAQAGWDMMKFQELRWFLNLRELHFPTIARIILLTPELVERILGGEFPGVHLSRDFKMILENENKYGFKQFASAQWRRLQLQVAGCRLLGYSGVQIAGIERPEHISTVSERIKEALKEFKDFETWKKAYSAHISRSDMAPFEHRYYLYRNLFKGSVNTFPEKNPEGIPSASISEKLHYLLCKSMFSKDHLLTPDEHRLTKQILVGCSSCNYCRLPMTHYICPENCPKGLANGPCGGSRIDGRCELREKKCIHIKRTRIAAWLNEIDVLEERYIKHPDIAAKMKQ